MAKNLLINNISEPLNGATTAKIDIHAGDGNLTIDRLTGDEHLLASGSLQYLEKQGLPTRSLVLNDNQAELTLRGGTAGQPWFHLPWSACNGATEWQVHLNSAVASDITAQTSGGNLRLDLAGMSVASLSADTGGGNVDVVLPDHPGNLRVNARTGGGNVVVSIPSDATARIHASTGLGKVVVDPGFNKTEKDTYQSPDFESAANKVEITLKSGAGNVVVSTR
jgi:DUF4097 and DUF4098 domain-containing protein YvlB